MDKGQGRGGGGGEESGSLHELGTQRKVLQDRGQDRTRTEGEPWHLPDESRR